MLKSVLALGLGALLVAACAAAAPPSTPQPLRIFASSATYPWLERVYDCASTSSAVVELSTPDTADITLHFGEPKGLAAAAFQIGRDDLLVVVQPQTAVGPLTLDQIKGIFSGQVTQWKSLGGADLPVQVWSYSPSEDIQAVFDLQVMQGQPIASLARLAVSAQAMSDAVGAEPGSIGILPRRWKAGNTNSVFTIPSVPVLALTAGQPEGAAKSVISCLQASD